MNNGRDKIWTQGDETNNWNLIDVAVCDEVKATRVAAQFLPLHGPVGNVSTIPALIIDPETMTVDDTLMTSLLDIWVEFIMTEAQVENEGTMRTAVTLARRAANILALAEDLLIFQGQSGIKALQNFKPKVEYRRPPHIRTGLLDAAFERKQVIEVPPIDKGQNKYGENTFKKVVEAITLLESKGKNQPYALVLNSAIFADTYVPLANTFTYAAQLIIPLVTAGFCQSGALPEKTGFVVSLGGSSMDRVVGVDAYTQYTQMDDDGFYHFRVYECFALRLMDDEAVVALKFL